MSLQVHFQTSAFGDRLPPAGVQLRVLRYRWQAVGGPDTAEMVADGDIRALEQLSHLLRCPLAIYRTDGQATWWGYLESLRLRKGRLQVKTGLDDMANRVRTRYLPLPPHPEWQGRPAYSEWAGDLESQARFGVKENQLSTGALDLASAERLRDARLAESAWPVVDVSRVETEADDRLCTALLTARGWWHTLGWRIYEQTAGLEQHAPMGSGSQSFGTPQVPMLRQAFRVSQSSEPWLADRAWLRVQVHGQPADGLVVEVCDALGAPLSQGQVAAGSLFSQQGWQMISISPLVEMTPNVAYELRVMRSGSLDADHYFRVDVDGTAGRTDGAFSLWGGGSWAAPDPPASLLFKLAGSEDTASQVRRMLDLGGAGQFFSALDLPSQTGIATDLWRSGENTTLAEVEALLQLGDSQNRRLLAGVDQHRRAWVRPRPAETEPAYALRADGSVLDAYGRKLAPGICPVGVWARGLDLPVLAPSGRVQPPPGIFIEWSEWDEENGVLRLG